MENRGRKEHGTEIKKGRKVKAAAQQHENRGKNSQSGSSTEKSAKQTCNR